MDYVRFLSLSRLGKDEVLGIEAGTCHVFPKLDGTNSSLFWDDANYALGAGSRNRKLSVGADNAGFLNHMKDHPTANELVKSFSEWNIFGEWLVPHSLKSYREEAWRQFYIFDVWDQNKGCYLHYDEYNAALSPILQSVPCNDIKIIPPMAIVKNGDAIKFQQLAEQNTYMIEDGKGCGEGVVIKNYDYVSKFGNYQAAKLVTNLFKEANAEAFGPREINQEVVEQLIAEAYVTEARIDKIFHKIEDDMGEPFTSKSIPRLLNTVYHDIIVEESWEFIKRFKQPTVNYKLLQRYVILQIKLVKPELF